MRSTMFMIVLLLGSAPGLWAQEQRSTAIQSQDLAWDRVIRIHANQKIEVQLQNGQKLKCQFVEANASGILLRIKPGKSVNISKEEILRITRRSAGRAALIGLGVGAGVGAAVGASGVAFAGSSDTGMKRSEGAAIFMLPLGLAGAAVGGLRGISVPIYENPTAKIDKRKIVFNPTPTESGRLSEIR